ncbi:hypothetical protein [Micromonospora endophytica]|uniref:Uncharacterized protein n=1 Tax=Micromonospora endophytica TaxID=515350 RepID=A0A2W2CFA6_9ACTN|nr:hypothetical protein [Micromonospora endophytica]PZF86987.1 hypothetical protein C1I93_26965 [Micromonospora endophytica]RIW48577.1 hypothetical protein D3H59_07270 [Micromonospora endophytica]BCJ61074.1 hypothetical protein Jiend_44960 [Micromonospora endophytica]
MLVDLVNEFAPRRFAICEEYGDRVDADVFAWGLAFADGALVCGDDRAFTVQFTNPDSAVRLFSRSGRRLRLLWVDAALPC